MSAKILKELSRLGAKGAITTIKLKKSSKVKTGDKNSWIKKAESLNKKANYAAAANIYYNLFTKETKIQEKTFQGINLVQTLINASNLDVAEQVLENLEDIAGKIKDESQKNLLLSSIYEKLGWIADLREKPKKQIQYFKKSLQLIQKVSPSKYKKEDIHRIPTINHFLGRALYKEYKNKKTKKINLKNALNYFQESLKEFDSQKNTLASAFNHAWIARIYMAQENTKKAEDEIKKAHNIFLKESKGDYNNVLFSHFHRLEAELAILKNQPKKAVENSSTALRMSLPEGAYYEGIIESLKLLIKSTNL